MSSTLRLGISTVWIVYTLTLVGCASKKDKELMQRPTLTPKRGQELVKDVNEAQQITDRFEVKATKAAYEQIRQDYAELTDYDLGLFAKAEGYLAKKKRARATKKYQKLTEQYPQSELVPACHRRLFEIGNFYLEGPVIANLLLFKIRGYNRGVKVLEKLTEEVGLSDPNGLGVRATINIAESQESRTKVHDAYLKWLELSTEWDEGPLGKMALLGMARTKLAAYNLPPEKRRVFYDGANLTNARQYYHRFALQYPEDANELNVAEIIEEIDELIAAKQLNIAQYYDHTGKKFAANLYLDMVIDNWPETAAAQRAREIVTGKETSIQ